MPNPKCEICHPDDADKGVIQIKGEWYCQWHYDEYLRDETFTCANCGKEHVPHDDPEAVQDDNDASIWYCDQDCAQEHEHECGEWAAHYARESHQSRFI